MAAGPGKVATAGFADAGGGADPATQVDLAVVGGGIAGLAAAWRARRAGLTVRLLESAPQVGGKIRSERVDGFLIEHGPHTFLGSATPLWQLLAELGISGHAVQAQPPSWRFVHRGGRTRRLPTGPWSALTGDWLSARAKLRALAEPWVPAASRPDEDLASFVARRFGREVADGLVAPFVTGVYAGDAAAIGARDAFPTLWQLERDHGGVLRGALARRRASRGSAPASASPPKRRGLYSLRDGMATLPLALADQLGPGVVRTGVAVASLTRAAGGWTLGLRDVASEGSPTQTLHARAVVLATPAEQAAELLQGTSLDARTRLSRARSCAMALVHLGGPETPGQPRGFGALVPRGEDVRALGMLLPSSLFPGRAPDGHQSYALFFGGAQDPAAAQLDDATLVQQAQESVRRVFGQGALAEVTFSRVVRWPAAIAQYEVGHRARMQAACEALLADAPGLFLAGSYVDGVSMSDAARSGAAAAEAATAFRSTL